MAVTARQMMDALRWPMFEKGMQRYWNILNQFMVSQIQAGATPGTTLFDAVDVTDASTGIELGTKTLSGAFAGTGTNATVGGEKTPYADPGGHYGPTPARQATAGVAGALALPTAGFKNS